MKNLFVSAGLVAIGAAGIQSVMADAMAGATASPKSWTVSATLRGFYDDNYATSNTKKGSFGVELSPSISDNVSLQQTDFGIRYTYGLYWYQERQILGQNPFDQSHQLDVWLDHAFDERWKVNISDTFAVGQEPTLLNPGVGTAPANPYRVEGNNIANHFNIKLDTQWTRQLSTDIHYENDFYYYQNNGGGLSSATNAASPSLAGTLNRFDQNAGIDLQWHIQQETMAFVGYSIDWVNYIANEAIGVNPALTGPQYFYSRDRDLVTHQAHIGLQHQFTSNLGGTVSVGANYTDSYNDDSPGQSKTSWSPYANLSLTYTYLAGSYAQLGFTHDVNSTDVADVSSGGSLTQYQESSTVYASINHRFTDKLLGSVVGQVVYSDFQGGGYDNDADTEYSFGVNLTYQFNQFLSADVGYNYDNLSSDIPGRPYSRNEVYIGLTASY